MSRIAHIIGLLFALVLLSASKTFLLQFPLMSAGFLMLASFFYAVCTIASNNALFLFPVMFLGALSYYLFLFASGVFYIWYPAHSVILIAVLGAAKYIAQKRNKPAFSRAFNNGINITAAIFTVWAFSFAKTYWNLSPSAYILTFFGYAIFYFIQNLFNQQSKYLIHAWVYYATAGFLALAGVDSFLPLTRTAILLALIFALGSRGIKIHRLKGHGYAIPFFNSVLISSLFSFVYSAANSPASVVTFFVNSIAFWFLYKGLRESQVRKKVSFASENFFVMFFKSAFLLLPVFFWILLLCKGFPVGFLNIAASSGYAFFFVKLANGPYRSLVKGRNHYVYLSVAFFTALFYFILPFFKILFTPALILIIIVLAKHLRDRQDTVKSMSIMDMAILPVAINIVLSLSSGDFNPVTGLLLSGITLAIFIAFLAYLKDYTLLYSISLAVWFALYSAITGLNLSAQILAWIYLLGGLLFATASFKMSGSQKGVSKIFSFSSLGFSLSALYFSSGSLDLRLIVLASMAIMHLSLGVNLAASRKSAGIFSIIGHLAAVMALTTVIFRRLFDQSIYVTILLAMGYFLPFMLHKKRKYLYPAGILASIGYLLLLVKICPHTWAMLAYLPVTAAFLFYRRSLPALVCAYFSSVIVLTWSLNASAANPAVMAFSSLLYGISFVMSGKKKPYFFAAALCFLLTAFYFLLRFFLPIEQALIFFSVLTFVFFVTGVIIRRYLKYRVYGNALIGSAIIVLFITTAASMASGFIIAAKVVIIVSGLAYIAAAFLFKQEIFLYLLTLNIAMLFFNFMQSACTVFTQDLFVYFLYGVILIGVLFIIPYIKKLRRYGRVFMMFTISNWKGVFFYLIPVSIALLLVFMLYSVKITEHPQFCGICHYMDDYIESWEHSSHKEVKCVDCHYEPGVKAVAMGKVAGLLQMAKYMTHTYSSMPKAEVSDASCLRTGCHDKMDKRAPIVFRKGIVFRHSQHLDQDIEKHRLRCATCHSQSVEGEHLSITKSPCFLCHFKKKGKRISKCTFCHKVFNKDLQFDDIAFNHRELLEDRKRINCAECHEGMIKGTGEVVSNNCLFCHTKKDARKDVSVEALHEKHTTEHKVECFQCHMDILHGQ